VKPCCYNNVCWFVCPEICDMVTREPGCYDHPTFTGLPASEIRQPKTGCYNNTDRSVAIIVFNEATHELGCYDNLPPRVPKDRRNGVILETGCYDNKSTETVTLTLMRLPVRGLLQKLRAPALYGICRIRLPVMGCYDNVSSRIRSAIRK
jgi:hypothetical protein